MEELLPSIREGENPLNEKWERCVIFAHPFGINSEIVTPAKRTRKDRNRV
jgi:hypothetical protein